MFTIDYQEIDINRRIIELKYDFYLFNYHPQTMGWLNTKLVNRLPGYKATIVLEVAPGDPFVMVAKDDFDGYFSLDPTLTRKEDNVYSLPRPLDIVNKVPVRRETNITTIGSFGFATSGKGFEKVIDAVAKEFETATIKINIPKGDYVSNEAFENLVNYLKNYNIRRGIQLDLTHNYFSKEELIDWCTQNDLNVFLYDRQMPGLSATTDQAVISERPLAISTNPTFRHLHKYLMPYPFQSLRHSITNSAEIVRKIKGDWSPLNFAKKFDFYFNNINIKSAIKSNESFELPAIEEVTKPKRILRLKISDFVPPVVYKLKSKITKKSIAIEKISNTKTLNPFVHYTLNSKSQFNEDLIIDLLLQKKSKGFYIDVGANHPVFNSNTKKFYDRGWNGINIEPNPVAFSKVFAGRPMDINLNVAISDKNSHDLTLFNVGQDTTLSSLDKNAALEMSVRMNLPIHELSVKVRTLASVLEEFKISDIDFMSVDAEGHDLSVLKSSDWVKFRPTLVIVESNNEFDSIVEFLDKKDYLHIYSNYFNSFFMDKFTKNEDLLRYLNWL
ncbi:MAG: FkbM family methyltransferase [Puia sp.]